MVIELAVITNRSGRKRRPSADLLMDYVLRARQYCTCSYEIYASERELLQHIESVAKRTTPVLVLADSAGKLFSSNDIAALVGRWRDSGTQMVVFAVGPADGWSETALDRADSIISFGRITLPHELAALVASEQIYRALTILAGHPYHTGHSF